MTKKKNRNRADADYSALPQPVAMVEDFGPVIFRYTRTHAIEDGVLIDAGRLAKEAGFNCPVALTSAAWAATVDGPQFGQVGCEEGRLWDVLHMLRVSAPRASGNLAHFTVMVADAEGRMRDVSLRALCGPGDDGIPVITILLPHED